MDTCAVNRAETSMEWMDQNTIILSHLIFFEKNIDDSVDQGANNKSMPLFEDISHHPNLYTIYDVFWKYSKHRVTGLRIYRIVETSDIIQGTDLAIENQTLCKHRSDIRIFGIFCSLPDSSRLYRLGVSQAQKAKVSGDERPRLRAS